MPNTLLVDYDIVAFKFAYVHEIEILWGDGESTVILQYSKAEEGVRQFISKLQARCECDNVVLCMTGHLNFRYAVLETYKHNRVDVEKPVLIDHLREWAKGEYEVLQMDGLEADDLLGIYSTKDTVIATIDKDLKQIPGRLYMWNKDTIEDVSLRDADFWFYKQIITGDSVDGYGGCPGAGPKKAEQLLKDTPRNSWWLVICDLYRETYEKALELREKLRDGKPVPKRNWWTPYISLVDAAGGPEEYALKIARVARICRKSDFDGTKVILWSPRK